MADHLLEDPTFMALGPIEMIEYLQRLNMSDPEPSAARADLLSGLHRMLEDNVPLSQVCMVILDILFDIQKEQRKEQQQQRKEEQQRQQQQKQQEEEQQQDDSNGDIGGGGEN